MAIVDLDGMFFVMGFHLNREFGRMIRCWVLLARTESVVENGNLE